MSLVVPPYPPPRYTRDDPEVSARLRRGPGPHFHRAVSEAFFVLSGTVRLYDGAQWTEGIQNDFLYVPPGGIHGFRNEADEPASMLMLFAPGAPREQFFEGLAHLGEMTPDEIRHWLVNNDNFFI